MAQTEAAAVLIISQDEPERALAAAEASLASADRSGDRKARGMALIQVAQAETRMDKGSVALGHATEAADICEELRFDAGHAAALALTARILASQGGGEDDAEAAFDAAEDSLRIFRRLGAKKGESVALWSQAQAEVSFGRAQAAVAAATEALGLIKETRDRALEAAMCQTLADGALKAGDARRARAAVARAQEVQAGLGNKKQEAACMHRGAKIEIEDNDPAQAATQLEKAKAAYRAARDAEGEAAVLATERDMHMQLGAFSEAMRCAKETVSLFHDVGDRKSEGRSLLKVCELLLQNNDLERSYKLAEVAMGILAETQDRDAITEGMVFFGKLKNASDKRDIERVLDDNAAYIHLPKTMKVDPGFKQKLADDFQEASRKGVF